MSYLAFSYIYGSISRTAVQGRSPEYHKEDVMRIGPVEEGVAVPESNRNAYGFDVLGKGQSFLIMPDTEEETTVANLGAMRKKIATALIGFRKKNDKVRDYRSWVSASEGGVRVACVEDRSVNTPKKNVKTPPPKPATEAAAAPKV